nr:glycoside hydrolase family 38 C-terminal domain-containing protein [uncultured Eisenbergiella sp.]
MGMVNGEWEDRLAHWIRTLKQDFYEELGEIAWEAFRTKEPLTLQDLKTRKPDPVKPGYTWGECWEYCWFRGVVRLPDRAQGERIVLHLQPGGESCLFVNGTEFGTFRADWIEEPHHYMVDNTLTRCAAAGDTYEICMETYAGQDFPNCETGYCATGPVLPGSYLSGLAEGSRRILGRCTYGIWREDAYQLYMDIATLRKLLKVLEDSSLRAAEVAEALKEFTRIVDFEQDAEARLADYRKARLALRPVMEAVNGTTAPLFWAVGNAHLDLAWLWPVAETQRKAERTFAAQLRLLEEYPGYRFIQSQPALYEMCRIRYPELFERILTAIKKGNWIADGAMWVEPDTNLTGGESLVRQLLHGKRYYREVLGVESDVLWLPDTFGYSGALPQILAGFGVTYLVTQKIFWCCNDGERFPYHYFTWEGMDGTKVVSFLPTSYTYKTDPEEIGNVWRDRSQKEDLKAFLLPFGYGDGGGGPTRDHLEYICRQQDLEGSPRMRMGSPREFFQFMEKQGGPKHTYTGELYFSSHRGTYTSQAKIKKYNRACELALREMEWWSALAGRKGMAYDRSRADRLWKLLLFQQFHDILPGSSIARVNEEARKAFLQIWEESQEMLTRAADYLLEDTEETGMVTVFNSLSFPRKTLITLPEEFRDGAVTADGKRIAVQRLEQEWKALVDLPAGSGITLFAAAGGRCAQKAADVPAPGQGASLRRSGDGYVMENEWISARINPLGQVESFLLKSSGRELAAGPMNRLRLFKDIPRHFDAWDIDAGYREMELDGVRDIRLEKVSEGLEAVLAVNGKIGNSSFTQTIRLAAGQERLEFHTRICWQELHRLLKTAFPVKVHAETARNEIQFGFVERPVHRSREYDKDRFEVCNHRYTALCDEAHGAAVLNDGKYGISMEGNSLELSLLRAPSSPEMRADNGIQEFTYAFYGWEGSFVDSGVVRQGYELNVKPPVRPGRLPALETVRIDRENIILDTMKPAEDGSRDVILRLYEAGRAAVTANLELPSWCRGVCLCDMQEQEQEALVIKDGGITLAFRAFEIKTIRLSILI